MSGLDICTAGARPKMTAVTSDTPSAKSPTRRSGADDNAPAERSAGSRPTSSSPIQIESTRPRAPPASASSTLSKSVWRTMRARPAPSASRRLTSFCRAAARATRRLATFAHAMSSTSPTMAISTASGVLNPWRSPDSPRPAGSTTRLLARKRSLKTALDAANCGTDSSSDALTCL